MYKCTVCDCMQLGEVCEKCSRPTAIVRETRIREKRMDLSEVRQRIASNDLSESSKTSDNYQRTGK